MFKGSNALYFDIICVISLTTLIYITHVIPGTRVMSVTSPTTVGYWILHWLTPMIPLRDLDVRRVKCSDIAISLFASEIKIYHG